jgi:hypothetical protein
MNAIDCRESPEPKGSPLKPGNHAELISKPSGWQVMAVIGIVFSAYLASHIPLPVRQSLNVWFGADVPRVVADMTNPDTEQWRTYLHPFFPLIFLPVGQLLTKLLSRPFPAAQVLISLSAGAIIYSMHAIMQTMGLSSRDRLLMIGVFLSSSSFMFWWSVQETFPLGAATLMLPFLLLARGDRNLKSWTLALTAAFSITITNVSAGLLAAWFSRRRLQLGRLILGFLLALLTLSALQKIYLPRATAFWDFALIRREKVFLAKSSPDLRSPLGGRMLDMGFYGAVTPATPVKFAGSKLIRNDPPSLIYPYSTQVFEGARLFPTAAWAFLLIAGIGNLMLAGWTELSCAMGLYLIFQAVLHAAYGDQPFLYSAHFMPVMVLMAAYGLRQRVIKPFDNAIRISARIAALIFIVFAIPLNLQAFFKAVTMASTFRPG